MLKGAVEKIYLAEVHDLITKLNELCEEWSEVTMMAKTHGQPASPTRLGKELAVFVERLEQQLQLLNHVPWSAKFGGATGNFNAHVADYQERSEEHTSELQSLMRNSYDVFCLKKT